MQIAVAARGAALAVHHRPVQTIYGAPAWKALVVVLILVLVPRAVVVVAIVELPLAVGVAVEVFVVIIGIRARFAGVPAFRGRRQVVHGGAVLARGAGVSAPQVPVVSALHRPVARGAVVVVLVPVLVLVPRAVVVVARLELRLAVGVAVEVFVVIIGIRARFAGVPAFRGRRQVVHGGAVLARGAGVSAPQVPVVSALHRPVARGAVVVVLVPVLILVPEPLRALPALGGLFAGGVYHPVRTRRVADVGEKHAYGNVKVGAFRAGVPVGRAAVARVDRLLRAIAEGGRRRAGVGVACRA